MQQAYLWSFSSLRCIAEDNTSSDKNDPDEQLVALITFYVISLQK